MCCLMKVFLSWLLFSAINFCTIFFEQFRKSPRKFKLYGGLSLPSPWSNPCSSFFLPLQGAHHFLSWHHYFLSVMSTDLAWLVIHPLLEYNCPFWTSSLMRFGLVWILALLLPVEHHSPFLMMWLVTFPCHLPLPLLLDQGLCDSLT